MVSGAAFAAGLKPPSMSPHTRTHLQSAECLCVQKQHTFGYPHNMSSRMSRGASAHLTRNLCRSRACRGTAGYRARRCRGLRNWSSSWRTASNRSQSSCSAHPPPPPLPSFPCVHAWKGSKHLHVPAKPCMCLMGNGCTLSAKPFYILHYAS